MRPDDPRIAKVTALSPGRIGVAWKGVPGFAAIELTDWIASGGDILAPLRDADIFRTVRVGDHGAAVIWGEEDGDLAIDAIHLKLILSEQDAARHAPAAELTRLSAR